MFDYENFKVFFRDSIVPFSEAKISIANTGFLYGLGVFSGIRVHQNTQNKKLWLFRPGDHFKRLQRASKVFNYRNFLTHWTIGSFISMLCDLVKVNEIDQDVYIRVTNFTDENFITPKLIDYKDSLSAFLYPLGDYVATDGIKCMVSSWQRVHDNALPARGKISGCYVNTAFAKTEALQNGFDEALVLDSNGCVVEGSAENLFLVRNEKLITPPLYNDILEGITRDTIIKLAKKRAIKVEERPISRTELYFADEVFLSGTGARVCPVVEIDHKKLSNGTPGKISKSLQSDYDSLVRGELKGFPEDWLVEV